MCCASLLETVTEKTCQILAPLCVNNPYFLYAPYFPTVPQQTTLDLYSDEDLDEMIAAQEKFSMPWDSNRGAYSRSCR